MDGLCFSRRRKKGTGKVSSPWFSLHGEKGGRTIRNLLFPMTHHLKPLLQKRSASLSQGHKNRRRRWR
jgi:hypothetical protein